MTENLGLVTTDGSTWRYVSILLLFLCLQFLLHAFQTFLLERLLLVLFLPDVLQLLSLPFLLQLPANWKYKWFTSMVYKLALSRETQETAIIRTKIYLPSTFNTSILKCTLPFSFKTGIIRTSTHFTSLLVSVWKVRKDRYKNIYEKNNKHKHMNTVKCLVPNFIFDNGSHSEAHTFSFPA